jgi:hypothetical protein
VGEMIRRTTNRMIAQTRTAVAVCDDSSGYPGERLVATKMMRFADCSKIGKHSCSWTVRLMETGDAADKRSLSIATSSLTACMRKRKGYTEAAEDSWWYSSASISARSTGHRRRGTFADSVMSMPAEAVPAIAAGGVAGAGTLSG